MSDSDCRSGSNGCATGAGYGMVEFNYTIAGNPWGVVWPWAAGSRLAFFVQREMHRN